MQRSNKIDLAAQMQKALLVLFGVEVTADMLFTIRVDMEPGRPAGRHDDMLRLHIFPHWQTREFAFEELIGHINIHGDRMPLWIKILEIGKGECYQLTISRRFHSKKGIEQRHIGNELMPFLPEAFQLKTNV